MDSRLKTKIVAAAAAAVAVAGGGVAIAATQLGSPSAESQAVINDAAGQLGVEPSKLSDALKKALENRVDAAMKDGRLTRAQGDALKQRIEAGGVPLFGVPLLGFPFRAHFRDHFRHLEAAASYLGLTDDQLRAELAARKTLAQIARAHDKSVDGLVDAMTAEATKRLDQAVAAGRLTKAQRDDIAAELKQHLTAFVNGKRPPAPLGGPPFRDRGRFEAPPPRVWPAPF